MVGSSVCAHRAKQRMADSRSACQRGDAPGRCGREGQGVRDGHRVWRVAGLHVVGEPGQDVFGMIEFVSQAAAHPQIVGDHLLQPSHATPPPVGHGRASPASLRWSVLA